RGHGRRGLYLLLATGDERRGEDGYQAQGHELLHIPHLLFSTRLSKRKNPPLRGKAAGIISQPPPLSTGKRNLDSGSRRGYSSWKPGQTGFLTPEASAVFEGLGERAQGVLGEPRGERTVTEYRRESALC